MMETGPSFSLRNKVGSGMIRLVWNSISNAGTSGTCIGIDSTVEVRECEVAIGYIGRITCFVVPRLEVRDLGAADTQQDPQDLQVGYLLCERGIQAAAALLDEREVESRSVRDGL